MTNFWTTNFFLEGKKLGEIDQAVEHIQYFAFPSVQEDWS